MNLKQWLHAFNLDKPVSGQGQHESALPVSDDESLASWRWAHIRSDELESMLSDVSGLQSEVALSADKWPSVFFYYTDDVEREQG